MARGGGGNPVTPRKVDLLSQGRLTLQSGVPVPTSDQVGKSIVYFTPYLGDTIALWNGVNWLLALFSEISITLSGLTSGKNYDVFAYFDPAGNAPVLELSSAWTNDTTRADALTLQNGIRVKAADNTRRYIGTIRATGAATTEDSLANRLVLNYYNRVRRPMYVNPGYINDNAVTTYATSSATWVRPSSVAPGASPGSTLTFLSNGEDDVEYIANFFGNNAAGGGVPIVGVGVDSVTQAAVYGNLIPQTASTSSSSSVGSKVTLSEGAHTLDMLIASLVQNPATFYADVGRVGGDAADVPSTLMAASVMN